MTGRRSSGDGLPMNTRSPGGSGGESHDLAGRADLRLGNCLVRPSLRSIAGPLGVATLEPRVMRVLVAFADAPHEVLSREALMRRCWDGAVVGDDAINRTVAEIRRVARQVGGDFGIRTIARVGYQLDGQVHPAAPPEVEVERALEPVPAPASTAADAARPRSGRRAMLAGSLAMVAVVGTGGLMTWRAAQRDARFAGHVTRADQALRQVAPGGARVARDALQEAIALRDDEPRAWGLLALAYYQLSEGLGPTPAPGQDSRDALRHESLNAQQRALDLDEGEPSARVAQALLDWRGDWHATEQRLQQVRRSAPGHFAALDYLVALLQGAGYVRESDAVNDEAIRFDDQRPMPAWRKALKNWILGNPQDAVRIATAAHGRWSDDPLVWQAALIVFAFTGDFSAARRLVQSPSEVLSGSGQEAWIIWLDALENRSAVQTERAIRVADSVATRPLLASHAILVLSSLGASDAAFRLFESRAFLPALSDARATIAENASSRWHQWLFCPAAAGLHAHPAFRQACDRLGLTSYWIARGVQPDLDLAWLLDAVASSP